MEMAARWDTSTLKLPIREGSGDHTFYADMPMADESSNVLLDTETICLSVCNNNEEDRMISSKGPWSEARAR